MHGIERTGARHGLTPLEGRMEKTKPEDRNEVDDEPVGDDELEGVSGGTVGWDTVSVPRGRWPQRPQDPLAGMVGELTDVTGS